jgi:hypothetical protein
MRIAGPVIIDLPPGTAYTLGYMKLRTLAALSFVWEAGRFVLLMNLLQFFLNPLGTREYGFFFFWFASYAFFIMTALGAASFFPEKFGPFLPVAGAGKLLQALAGLLFLLYEIGVIPVLAGFFREGIEGLVPAALMGGAVPAAGLVVLLDLLFGIFLLQYRAKVTGSARRLSVPVDSTDVEEE